MSMKSWKEEFYPIDADIAAEQGAIAATKHSLQKWIGVRPENISKHYLVLDGPRKLTDLKGLADNDFFFDDNTCSLCRYSLQLYQHISDDCFNTCPLGHYLKELLTKKDLRQIEDEEFGKDEACSDAYNSFLKSSDPEPMISVLEKTVEMLEGKMTIEEVEKLFPTKE